MLPKSSVFFLFFFLIKNSTIFFNDWFITVSFRNHIFWFSPPNRYHLSFQLSTPPAFVQPVTVGQFPPSAATTTNRLVCTFPSAWKLHDLQIPRTKNCSCLSHGNPCQLTENQGTLFFSSAIKLSRIIICPSFLFVCYARGTQNAVCRCAVSILCVQQKDVANDHSEVKNGN